MLTIVLIIFYEYPYYFHLSCTFEEFEKEITENFFGCLIKDYVSDYAFVKVNDHKAHTLIDITDTDKFGASIKNDEAKEFDKRNNCKDIFYNLDLIEKVYSLELKRSFLLEKTNENNKNLFHLFLHLGFSSWRVILRCRIK